MYLPSPEHDYTLGLRINGQKVPMVPDAREFVKVRFPVRVPSLVTPKFERHTWKGHRTHQLARQSVRFVDWVPVLRIDFDRHSERLVLHFSSINWPGRNSTNNYRSKRQVTRALQQQITSVPPEIEAKGILGHASRN